MIPPGLMVKAFELCYSHQVAKGLAEATLISLKLDFSPIK